MIDRYVKPGIQIESSESHPCGAVVSKCLTHITETEELSPTWAYELSPAGEVINKWPMPVDGQVWAVSGDQIYVAYPNYEDESNGWTNPNYIKIGPKGFISKLRKISKSEKTSFGCAKMTENPTLQNAYCWEFSDMATRESRFVSSEPICS